MFNRNIVSLHLFAFSSICFLATPVASQNITSKLNPEFVETFNFTGQDNGIQLSDWISLLTLCLAPLIAHIIAGVPRTVNLSLRPIKWHDWICIYNPTSILWRYFAITDRRVRHKAWNATDMASSNTYFWTEDGWNGSEEIMVRGRELCTKTPRHHRTAIFSFESIQTIIIGAQGVQAIYVLVTNLMGLYGVGKSSYKSGTTALDSTFSPLAILGLLRLFASLWLTDDYSYTNNPDATEMSLLNSSGKAQDEGISFIQEGKEQSTLTISRSDPSYTPIGEVFRPQSYWLAIALRILYLLPLCGLLALCVLEIFPTKEAVNEKASSASYLRIMFYLAFLLLSIAILVFYIVLGKSTTTVIPCINSTFYKICTSGIFLLALLLLISTAASTRKTFCGKYTIFPKEYDYSVCNGAPIHASTYDWPFGMVAYVNGSTNSINETREIEIMKLDGWCSGVLGSSTIVDIIDPQT